jgi:hypothetical protein
MNNKALFGKQNMENHKQQIMTIYLCFNLIIIFEAMQLEVGLIFGHLGKREYFESVFCILSSKVSSDPIFFN